MATQVQFRRGTTTQNNAFTGALAEITYDTEVKTLRLHDGTTAGGGAIVATLAGTQTFTNKTLSTNSVWNGSSIGLAFGGTNASITPTAGAVAYSTSSAIALTASGTSGQVLTSAGGSAPTWTPQSALTVGTAANATTATNIAGGSAGQIVIQLDANQTTFISAGAAGTFLQSTGASTAPTFAAGEITIGSTSTALGATSTSLAGLDILASIGTSHWTLPAGNTSQRPGSAANGMIRYNSQISSFEGYGPGGAWGSLGGVKDVDGDTFITTETSPGSDEDTFTFFNANTATATLSTTILDIKSAVRVDINNSLGVGTTASGTTGEILAVGGVRLTSANPFVYTATTVSANITIPVNFNAMAAGPITINNNVVITVPDGSTLTIV